MRGKKNSKKSQSGNQAHRKSNRQGSRSGQGRRSQSSHGQGTSNAGPNTGA